MIVDQAQAVGNILHEYIAIHNDVFAGGPVRTLRRLLPIPGFFEAIDFEGHARSLAILSIQLEAISRAIGTDGAPTQLAQPLALYSQALLETVRHFAHICGQLDRRAESPAAYKASEYKHDLAEYEASVARYRALGESVNRAFRAPLS